MTPKYYDEPTVENMLYEWGREYRLDWVEIIGHQGKNILYDLIRFRGRIPQTIGYQPAPCNSDADMIEGLVMRLYRLNPKAATCVRLMYCGRGSVKDKAEIAASTLGRSVSRATFKTMVRMGQMYILGELNARAAA